MVLGPSHQIFTDGSTVYHNSKRIQGDDRTFRGLAIKTSQFLTVTIAIMLVGFVFYFLQKNKTGKAMRAHSDNEDLALLSGIDPAKVVRVTWILVAGLQQ